MFSSWVIPKALSVLGLGWSEHKPGVKLDLGSHRTARKRASRSWRARLEAS